MSTERKCGCKGIRTCLLCEQQNSVLTKLKKYEEVQYVYTYCPRCDLCWPDDEATASSSDFPLFIGKLKLNLEFISTEEETSAISSIDNIPWMPSQSGRRKQDFGPKVNFKKKKVKIGEFKGFPKFTESILKKFNDLPELTDFQPVELCHLEYTPERGSSIDPHVDDFWLWGERLVTVNLGSSTVLTLVPCSEHSCKCLQEADCDSFKPTVLFNEHTNEEKTCNHKFQDRSVVDKSLKSLYVNDVTASKIDNMYSGESEDNVKNSEVLVATPEDKTFSVSSTLMADENTDNICRLEEIQYPENHLNRKNCTMSKNDISSSSLYCSEISDPHRNKNKAVKINDRSYQNNNGNAVPPVTNLRCVSSDSVSTNITDNKMNTMCNVFRSGANNSKVRIRVVLPPRSLLVLAGCARYNWFHEIKRQDVVARRLAMTFRELTPEFLDGGKESQFGKDMLLIANNLYDL